MAHPVGDEPGGGAEDLLPLHQAVGRAGYRPWRSRSTMPCARPTNGASSTDPCTRTTSACRPVAAKCASAVRVLGGHPHRAEVRQRGRRRVHPVRGGVDHPAPPEAQVEQLVDVRRLLAEHVLAHQPEVGRAALHVGRHVARARGDEGGAVRGAHAPGAGRPRPGAPCPRRPRRGRRPRRRRAPRAAGRSSRQRLRERRALRPLPAGPVEHREPRPGASGHPAPAVGLGQGLGALVARGQGDDHQPPAPAPRAPPRAPRPCRPPGPRRRGARRPSGRSARARGAAGRG